MFSFPVCGHLRNVEAIIRLSVCRPLFQDRGPAQACLGALEDLRGINVIRKVKLWLNARGRGSHGLVGGECGYGPRHGSLCLTVGGDPRHRNIAGVIGVYWTTRAFIESVASKYARVGACGCVCANVCIV